jgi:hypothetical protein
MIAVTINAGLDGIARFHTIQIIGPFQTGFSVNAAGGALP